MKTALDIIEDIWRKEVDRLELLICEHNAECYESCSLSDCEDFRARHRLCPTCPRYHTIEDRVLTRERPQRPVGE